MSFPRGNSLAIIIIIKFANPGKQKFGDGKLMNPTYNCRLSIWKGTAVRKTTYKVAKCSLERSARTDTYTGCHQTSGD